MSKLKTRLMVVAACAAMPGVSAVSSASIISGTVSGRVGTWPFDASMAGPPELRSFVVGDGVNHVTIVPGFGTHLPWEAALWFYGSHLDGGESVWHDTDVALLPGVTDVALITDASMYTYTNGPTPEQVQATDYTLTGAPPPDYIFSPPGIVLLRNTESGHYGAIVFRDAHSLFDEFEPSYGEFSAIVEIDWYFQSDGTGDFSSIPAPGALGLLGVAGLACLRRRR